MSGNKFLSYSLLIFLCSWFILSLQGLRGTDHYWYWAAVRSIVERGEIVSNTVFPATAFTQEYIGSPFIHNIPQVYLASIPSFIFGYKWGWSLFNLFSILGSFYLLFKMLLFLNVQMDNALFSLSIWILAPINVWMSFQPNSEAFVSFLVLLSTYLIFYTYHNNSLKSWILLIFVLTVFVATRINFTIFVLLLPSLFFSRGKKIAAKCTLVFVTVVLMGWVINFKLFPASSNGAITEALQTNQENPYSPPMLGFYNTENPKLDVQKMISTIPRRIINVLSTQLFNRHNIIFYTVYNLTAVILMGILLLNNSFYQKNKLLFNLYFILLITHLFTSFVFQNQFRYLFTIFAVSLLIFYSLMAQFQLKLVVRRGIINSLQISVIVIFAVSTYFFLQKVRNESRADGVIISQIKNFVESENLQAKDNVFLVSQNSLYSFALFPRKVLSFNMNSLPDKTKQEIMVKNIRPKWFINNTNRTSTELSKGLTMKLGVKSNFQIDNYEVYKIAP